MPGQYSRVNLAELEDAAPANGFADRWQARVARTALGARQTGITHFRPCESGRFAKIRNGVPDQPLNR